jgi:hypothetical protein
MLRLRAYEKLQNLVFSVAVKKNEKIYTGNSTSGGGDARVPAPPQRVNPSITEAPLPASKAKRLPEELSSNPGSSRLCSCACVP